MKFIEEVVVDAFLPTYRSMLAEALREQGLTQREVADVLGISQSAVSKYAHGEIDRHPRVADDDRVRELVDRTASGLATETMSPIQALIEAEVLIRELERGDLLADLHRTAEPRLADEPGASAIHDPDGRLRERARILDALRTALARLERLGGFAGAIPQVGSNLVYARDGAQTVDDVAGVPGRIVEVKGRATVPADPEFGVSEHVASVVLAAMRAGSDARAGLNLSHDDDRLQRMASAGHRTVEVSPAHDLTDAVESAIAEVPEATVVYHDDGPGIEANSYLLGPDPGAVVDIVSDAID